VDGRFKVPTAPGLGLDYDADELQRRLRPVAF
jgi:L-alanine-DL-glutamate epimerase-like enolase superfamily enzyme